MQNSLPFNAAKAAHLLSNSWKTGEPLQALASDCTPITRAQGYAVQALWAEHVGPIAGWKIAATSLAGQHHIGVSGPLVGPVFAHRVVSNGATVSLALNRMRVAECEIVFRFGQTLSPRMPDWQLDDILSAVESVHPGIEVPDSRFIQFESAGESQLTADCACGNDMVLGAPVTADDRLQSLHQLHVHAKMSDGRSMHGMGSNVLGDPLEALRWFVNEITQAGQTVHAGQFVTTGACVVPIPVLPGQTIEANFDWLGHMTVRFN